jgi:hypothetical protein
VVECLLSMQEALGFTKKKSGEREGKEEKEVKS